VSHTGVGGLTLGRWIRAVVTAVRADLRQSPVDRRDHANGKFTTIGPKQDKELFWGMRGGGGNFGIATSFELQLHPSIP
jgi:FAD/FMN-containing dehydrogenase